MNLQPINDRILVKLFEHPAEEQKIGSIIVPEIAREKENICGSQVYLDKPFHRGTVVAAGPGALVELTCKRCGDERVVRRAMSVKVGDVILFGRFFDMSFDDLVMLREDDILGVEAKPAIQVKMEPDSPESLRRVTDAFVNSKPRRKTGPRSNALNQNDLIRQIK